MTLSVGLDTALSGLATTAEQTSVASRNVARANDPNASRKIANVITLPGAGVRIASITRSSNDALFAKLLTTTSDASGQSAIVDALNSLDETVNDPEKDGSPAALIGKLTDALQQYAEAPQDMTAARSAVSAAGDLANALNGATQTVQNVRAQADADMADGVDKLNTLLGQFATLNSSIVSGTQAGHDVTDLLDQRDEILRGISEQIGIRTVARSNGDMAIYTDSGVTLFDRSARSVTFDSTGIYAAGTSGNAIYIDGVPVTGSSGPMLARSGRLVGLANIRDNVAPAYQSQLDEIARGLISAFAESDQSATPTLADAPGLFTYPGAPAMPASSTLVPGLAGTIRVAASVDPAQGGDAMLLRNGGIAGNPAYVYNTTGASAYSDRVHGLVDNLNAVRAFDPSTQLAPSASLTAYAASSVAWLQAARQSASDSNDYKSTLMQRSSDALSKDTGVNLDEEMTNLLELERSYQASSRLITTIDGMLDTLLQAVR